MGGHNPADYGEKVGADYDLLYPETHFEAATVSAIADLADFPESSRSVLEFGIGTGRLGLALLERGLDVAGIDASEPMLDHLRAKERADEIELVVGDFADSHLDRCFSVVALTFNGIFGLPNVQSQVDCFRNAARHVESGGCFVVEAYVLRPEQLSGDWAVWPRSVQHEHVELELARYVLATNRLERTLVHLRPSGLRFVPLSDTYAWPSELDLMARDAGLELRRRTGSWAGAPFDEASYRHVSVYQLTDD